MMSIRALVRVLTIELEICIALNLGLLCRNAVRVFLTSLLLPLSPNQNQI